MEVTECATDLHSGFIGGVAFNPNHALVEALSKLRDENGKILVPGFYDDVPELSDAERALIDYSMSDSDFEAKLGFSPIGGERNDYHWLDRRAVRPTIEINGINGGYSGEGFKTVIPGKAIAKVSCRLVGDQDPEKVAKSVTSYIREQIPSELKCEFDIHPGVGVAVKADPNSEVIKTVRNAYTQVHEVKCGVQFEGGSIPIVAELSRAISAEVALFGYGMAEDAIHAPNESFDFERLKKGHALVALSLLGLQK